MKSLKDIGGMENFMVRERENSLMVNITNAKIGLKGKCKDSENIIVKTQVSMDISKIIKKMELEKKNPILISMYMKDIFKKVFFMVKESKNLKTVMSTLGNFLADLDMEKGNLVSQTEICMKEIGKMICKTDLEF